MSRSNAQPDEDPFANVVDDPEQSPHDILVANLAAARRGWVPLRKTFVQRPSGSGPQPDRPSPRASVLSDLVRGRHHRPLDLILLLHALQPILEGTPFKLATWATMLSTTSPTSTTAVTRAIDTLVALDLVAREGSGHSPTLRLKIEDGTGTPWSKAGAKPEAGPGYFVLPHEFWTTGLSTRLTIPGKAMLLVTLAETQNPKSPSFKMAYERSKEWYGISERTAERGFRELSQQGLLLQKVQKVADRNHPAGRREEVWRALKAPFSTAHRQAIQATAATAAQGAGTP